MPGRMAETFMRTLQQLEGTRDVEAMVGLFADRAELVNPEREVTRRGPDGAREFWKDYLATFARVHSAFTRVREGEGFAVLEWVSDGTLPSGQPIRYPGASILEFEGDRVSRFITYYDSAAFLPQGAKRAPRVDGGDGRGAVWESAPPPPVRESNEVEARQDVGNP